MFVAGVLLSLPALAEDPGHRHGAAPEEPRPLTFEGGITGVFQHADDKRIKDEAVASLDLVITLPAGPGEWTLYVEGNATPRTRGVSSLLPGTNADAGTALDADGDGRLQVSELHYALNGAGGRWTLGLFDPKGFLDTSTVANDETTQFLGESLVNNLTIGFPDYTLGIVYAREARGALPGLTLTLTGSNGLADNEDRSYSELFSVGQEGKGVFAAAELSWGRQDAALQLGAWVNSADHERWDGSGTTSDHGLYGVLSRPLGGGMLGGRVGLANADVAEAENFVSLAWEYPTVGGALGIGIARAGASDEFKAAHPGNVGDLTQAEAYARLDIWKDLQVTPSIQFIRNSGFLRSETGLDRSAVVTGLRINYIF